MAPHSQGWGVLFSPASVASLGQSLEEMEEERDEDEGLCTVRFA